MACNERIDIHEEKKSSTNYARKLINWISPIRNRAFGTWGGAWALNKYCIYGDTWYGRIAFCAPMRDVA
jgi:hypothetical protein